MGAIHTHCGVPALRVFIGSGQNNSCQDESELWIMSLNCGMIA